MTEIRAPHCYWLLLSFFALNFSALTVTHVVAEGTAECVAQIARLQHRWDRKQSQLNGEKEELTKELERCRAAEMACGTREDLCKQKLATLDPDNSSISPMQTIRDLESQLRQCEDRLESTTLRETELENQTRILEQRLGSLQAELSVENNASKSLQEQLQVLRKEIDSCQVSRQSLLSQLGTLQDEMVEQQRQCESQQEMARQKDRGWTDQHHAELEAVRIEAQQAAVHQFQTAADSLTQQHANETLWIRQEATAQMEKERFQLEREFFAERQRLRVVIQKMHADRTQSDRILQTVKDDLFAVRRELFDLKEIHVRGPDRRRRLRIQWWRKWRQWFLTCWRKTVQAVNETLLHPLRRGRDRVLTLCEKYVGPLWRSLQVVLQPVWTSTVAFCRTAWRRIAAMFRILYPIMLQYADATWHFVSKLAVRAWLVAREKSSYWWSQFSEQVQLTASWTSLWISSIWDQLRRQRFSWRAISQCVGAFAYDAYFVAKGLRIELSLVARGLTIEIRERLLHAWMVFEQARQVIAEKYESDFKPRLLASVKCMTPIVENVTRQYRQHLEPHLQPLNSLVQQHVQPRLVASVEGHRSIQAATINALGNVTDLAMNYSRIHQYPEVLTRFLEWAKSHATELVYYGELILLVAITLMLVQHRRRRYRKTRSTASASSEKKRPSSTNGASLS